MDDNGTILLLRSIHDLILGLCALKISLIVFNFILIELQHMISVKAKIGLLGGSPANLDLATGLMVLAACLPIGIVGLISGKTQGETAAAGIGIVAKKPDQFGKAMLFPAMVETYAILSLLISILSVNAIKI